MKLSLTIRNAQTLDQVISAINRGGVCEGMEGVEFTAEELAGQYAAEAARESGHCADCLDLSYHLDFLAESGARFAHDAALAWALEVGAIFHAMDHEESAAEDA